MELEEEAFRRPLLRTKSFKSEEDKLKSRMGSYEEVRNLYLIRE